MVTIHEWKKGYKKNVEDFPNIFVYICTEKTNTWEKVSMILKSNYSVLYFLISFADQHFLKSPNSNYIMWGGGADFQILLPQIHLGLYFFPFFPLKAALNEKRLWRLLFCWLLSWYYFADSITGNYSESSVAEQLSLTTSNCWTLRA